MCGNHRIATLKECPFCGDPSFLTTDENQTKAFTMNLELGLPTVDEAFIRFEQTLEQLQGVGVRLVKVIHGQGSFGGGGKIKKAFRDALDYGKWSHAITEVYYGEALQYGQLGLEDFRKSHPMLSRGITPDMLGNSGITLLLLAKDY